MKTIGIVTQARERLSDAIHFRKDNLGYWHTDLVVDQIALQLIQSEYPGFKLPHTKNADVILTALSNKAWCCFHGE